MEREESPRSEKFMGEYHFPVTLEQVRLWSQGEKKEEVFSEFVCDTNDSFLLRNGHWLLFHCGKYWGEEEYHTLWLKGNETPITEPEEVLEKLRELLPDCSTSDRIGDYCPNMHGQRCRQWIITPELRVEFSDWMCYGKQGLYVCGISPLEEYQNLVRNGENKFTVCLHQTKPFYFEKLWPGLEIEPYVVVNNEQNPFIEFHRMKTFEEDWIDSWDDDSDSDEEDLLD